MSRAEAEALQRAVEAAKKMVNRPTASEIDDEIEAGDDAGSE